MKVLLYGALADAIDREIDVEFRDGCSVAEIRNQISRTHPNAAQKLSRSRAVLGDAAVAEDYCPSAADQLEFLPPVSGG